MKKGIIIILAVAILGLVGLHFKSNGSPASSNSASGGSQAANNSQMAEASQTSKSYKDGTYTSPTENSPYGNVQISVVVSGGKITDVNFLQMPSDLAHSQEITTYSEPLLKQETIKSQSANIDFVSGATVTSTSYQESLQAALDKAVIS